MHILKEMCALDTETTTNVQFFQQQYSPSAFFLCALIRVPGKKCVDAVSYYINER